MAFYVVISLCAFLLTLLSTRLLIISLRNRARPLDIATLIGRQAPPAPTGGGLVLITALIICLLAADISFGPVIGMFLLLTTYQLHRLINIAAPIRLLIEIMAVILTLMQVQINITNGALPPIADKAIITALWIWFMHQFKAMDALDGLCSVQAVAISAGITIMAVFADTFPDKLSTYGMIVSAGCIGFAWWNWHPAKVRMGEVGSVPLGFLLGYLLLLAYRSGYEFALFILPAYLIADSVATGLRRADVAHYFLRAVQKGRKPHNVVRLSAGVNILTAFLATRTTFDTDISIIYLALAYLSVFMLLGFFEHDPSPTPDHA
jgi:UDP-N-acetylmuramyl pentapeptide phosphotransferase/UDP-N-acetylglucosamine-1-phosphate transferase